MRGPLDCCNYEPAEILHAGRLTLVCRFCGRVWDAPTFGYWERRAAEVKAIVEERKGG